MSDIAPSAVAPAAAATPVTTPNAQPDPQAQSGNAKGTETAQETATRIELQKLPPSTRVVMVINGKDVEMSAADAAKRIGRGESANQRYEEAAQLRRQHAEEKAAFETYEKQFMSKLTNPAALREEMRALGMNAREIAEKLIQEEERFAAMSPAERKLLEYEQREEQRNAEQQAQKQQQYEQEKQAYAHHYTTAFHAQMTAEGIPEGHVFRDVLMPSLGAAAAHIWQSEGRDITKGEVRRMIKHVLEQSGSLRQPTPEDRLKTITDADYEAWMKAKSAARPQANPQAPRAPDGRFLPQDRGNQGRQGPRTNVNGERMVASLSSVYNR